VPLTRIAGLAVQERLLAVGVVELGIGSPASKSCVIAVTAFARGLGVDGRGPVLGEDVLALLPHQREDQPHPDRELREVGGEVVLGRSLP
jgi:hypothetical protein